MSTPLTAVFTVLIAAASPVDCRFAEIAPPMREKFGFVRTVDRDRAVILIHGLRIHPFTKLGVIHAAFSDWQKEDSFLVKQLSREADVFAFAYAQTVAADEVAEAPDLDVCVQRIRKLGYREIVLIGYSAGGLIARQFVEDKPDSGVTKVVQVCAPNTGSGWASLPAFCKQQTDFLHSLTKQTRQRTQGVRADRQLPPDLEFVCIIGTATIVGDGLVSTKSQWPDDLQRQGVPAVTLGSTHWHVMRSKTGAELLASLVREPQPRWDAQHVATVRRKVFGGP